MIAPVETDDVLLQVAPMTHASGAMFLPHAVVGARALLASRFDATRFAGIVERHRVTAGVLVPTIVVRVVELLDDDLSKQRDVDILRSEFRALKRRAGDEPPCQLLRHFKFLRHTPLDID